eukprot:gene5365-5600_t
MSAGPVSSVILLFVAASEDGSLAVTPKHYKLPDVMVAMIHDLAVTQDYYVVVVGPVNFSASKFITEYVTSRCSIAECLQYNPNQATKIHLVPRPRGAAVDDDVLWGPAQCVMKVTLPHPLAGTQEPLSEDSVGNDIWDAGSRCIVNEPLFVPRPGATAEDEGWVLVTVHDASTDNGRLVILDAQCLADGPVATIHLPHFLPAGLHGSFAADVFTRDGLNDAFFAAPEWREPNVVRAL